MTVTSSKVMTDSKKVSLRNLTRRQFNSALMASAAGLSFMPYGRVFAATTMNYVGWQGYDEPLIAADFLEKNDIVLERKYVDSNEAMITAAMSGGTGHLDVTTPYFGHAKIMIDAGLLDPLDMSKIPAFSEMMPFFSAWDDLVKDGTRYAVPFTWGTQPIMYRTDLVAAQDVPKTWHDLAKNPVFKGKLVMTAGVIAQCGVWSKPLLGHYPGSIMTHDQLKKVIDHLIWMKKNVARTYTDSYGEAVDILARGDATTLDIGWEPVQLWAADKGADISMVYPKGGTVAFMDTYGIVKDSPNNELAHAMINNGISIDGQVHLAKSLGQAVVNKAAVPHLSEQNRGLYRYKEMSEGDMEALADIAFFIPFPLQEPDGVHATHDDMLEEWDRFLKA